MNQRDSILFIALIGLLSLAIAYWFMQLYLGLAPCPLCIVDRYAIGTMSTFGLLCWFFYPVAKKLWLGIMMLSVAGGLASGTRHIYMEHFPYESDSCFLPLEENSLADFFINTFAGRSDCAVVNWRLWGVSLAEITFGLLVFLFIFMIYICFFAKSVTNDAESPPNH